MLNLGFRNFKPIFHGYLLMLIFTFFKTCFTMCKVLTINQLTFGDEVVRVLGLLIWNHLPETLKAKSSFQTLERSLNNWFWPKWKFLLKVSKHEEYLAFYCLLPMAYMFAFCHIFCTFLNFQLLAKMLKFIFIEFAWREWPCRLRHCDQNRNVLTKTALSDRSGLGTELWKKVPGANLWVKNR